MPDKKLVKISDRLIRIYADSVMPVFIVDDNLSVIARNAAAVSFFPNPEFPDTLKMLCLSPSVSKLSEAIKSGRSISASTTAEEHDPINFFFTPFGENGKFFGATVSVFAPSGSTLSSDNMFLRMERGYTYPLNSVFASLKTLESGIASPEDTVFSVKNISSNSFAMLRTTTQFINFGIMRNSSVSDFMQHFDIDTYFRELCLAIQSLTASSGIDVDFTDLSRPVFANGSMRWLTIGILSLVSNSLKYTKPGNAVSLKLSMIGKSAVITVSDKGLGMIPEVIANATLPFYSAEPDGKRCYTASGLGLTLAKCAAESFGGSFSLVSERSVGTTAVLKIPTVVHKKEDIADVSDKCEDYVRNIYSLPFVFLSDPLGAPEIR